MSTRQTADSISKKQADGFRSASLRIPKPDFLSIVNPFQDFLCPGNVLQIKTNYFSITMIMNTNFFSYLALWTGTSYTWI